MMVRMRLVALCLGLASSVLVACGDGEALSQSSSNVLAGFTRCNDGRLDTLRAACSALYDVGSDPVAAVGLRDEKAPLLQPDQIWGVRLVERFDGSYAGEIDMQIPTAGEWAIYLGTPNVPFEVIDQQPMCSRYISEELMDTLHAGSCDLLLGVYVLSLDAGVHRLRFGPIDGRSWIRVLAKQRAVTFAGRQPSPDCGAQVEADVAGACKALREPRPLNASLFGEPDAKMVEEGRTYGLDLAPIGVRNEGSVRFLPEETGDYLLYLGTPGMQVSLREDYSTTDDGAPTCTSFLPVATDDASCLSELREVSTFRLRAGVPYVLELASEDAKHNWVRMMLRRFDPGPIGGEACVTQLSAGGSHTCVLLDDGQVKCWGDNTHGQLGMGDDLARGDEPGEVGSRLSPVDLGDGQKATHIAAGELHTCAVLEAGQVKCWGNNDLGQLGLGDRRARGDDAHELGDRLRPAELPTDAVATAVFANGSHTCALLSTGSMVCWGYNASGQLGAGDTRSRGDQLGELGDALSPVSFGAAHPILTASLGGAHSCALVEGGDAACWGSNYFGQLGLESRFDRGDEPGELGLTAVDVSLAGDVSEVSAGNQHTCARLANGAVKCWGSNARGQLGLGPDVSALGQREGEMGKTLAAIALGEGRTARDLSAGGDFACALLDDDEVACWGDDSRGQRGDGLGESLVSVVDLGSGPPPLSLSAGKEHVCVLLSDKSIQCWGANQKGQLGLGHRDDVGDDAGEMGEQLPFVTQGCIR